MSLSLPSEPRPLSQRVGLGLAATAGIAIGWLSGSPFENDTASIGGTDVPRWLECQEDEVVQFAGIDVLACISIDTFVDREVARRMDDGWPAP